MGQLKGAAVNFGFTGTDGIAESNLTGKMQLQSADYESTADEEQIRDADGDLVNRTFYNLGFKATLEYIPSGADIATAVTNTALIAVGTVINITACASLPALVASSWVVVPGGKITGSNTSAKRITLPLEKHAGITAAAT